MKIRSKAQLKELETKRRFLTPWLSLIEDKYLGFLMKGAGKEKGIPLDRAKKLLR